MYPRIPQRVAPAPQSHYQSGAIAWEIGELPSAIASSSPSSGRRVLFSTGSTSSLLDGSSSPSAFRSRVGRPWVARVAGFWRSSWVVGVAVFLAAVATFFASSTAHPPPSRWPGAVGHGLRRLHHLGPHAAIAAAGIFPRPPAAHFPQGPTSQQSSQRSVFALAHLPNPILTPLTLIWGLTACLIFVRSRNVYPLAIAHAIFGICVAITIPASILHNMRVGLGYINYRPQPTSPQPERPRRIHRCMGDRRSAHPTLSPPRPSVEHSRNRRHQHIAPVEIH